MVLLGPWFHECSGVDKGREKDNFEVSDLFQFTKGKWIGTGFGLQGM